ncbi:unnamed protein product [Gordionus sp. m RMFG-2023]
MGESVLQQYSKIFLNFTKNGNLDRTNLDDLINIIKKSTDISDVSTKSIIMTLSLHFLISSDTANYLFEDIIESYGMCISNLIYIFQNKSSFPVERKTIILVLKEISTNQIFIHESSVLNLIALLETATFNELPQSNAASKCKDISFKYLHDLTDVIKEKSKTIFSKSSALKSLQDLIQNSDHMSNPQNGNNLLMDMLARNELNLFKIISESLLPNDSTTNECANKEFFMIINNSILKKLKAAHILLESGLESMLKRFFTYSEKFETTDYARKMDTLIQDLHGLQSFKENFAIVYEDLEILSLITSCPFFEDCLVSESQNVSLVIHTCALMDVIFSIYSSLNPNLSTEARKTVNLILKENWSIIVHLVERMKFFYGFQLSPELKKVYPGITSTYLFGLQFYHAIISDKHDSIIKSDRMDDILTNFKDFDWKNRSKILDENFHRMVYKLCFLVESFVPDSMIISDSKLTSADDEPYESDLKARLLTNPTFNLFTVLMNNVENCVEKISVLNDAKAGNQGGQSLFFDISLIDGPYNLENEGVAQVSDEQKRCEINKVFQTANCSLRLMDKLILIMKPTIFWDELKQSVPNYTKRTMTQLFANASSQSFFETGPELKSLMASLSNTFICLINADIFSQVEKVEYLSSWGVEWSEAQNTITSWPLLLPSYYLAPTFCTLISFYKKIDQSPESEENFFKSLIINCWQSFLARIQMIVSFTDIEFDEKTLQEDINIANLLFLMYLFHALPTLSDKGIIFSAVRDLIIDLSQHNSDPGKPVHIILITRICLIFEYLMYNFYQMPEYLMNQIKMLMNIREVRTEIASIFLFDKELQERLENHKALLGIKEETTDPRYFTLQSHEVYDINGQPKLDSLAAKFLVTALDYNAFYCSFVKLLDIGAHYDIIYKEGNDTKQSFLFYKIACDLEYMMTLLWRVLGNLPPSKEMIAKIANMPHETSKFKQSQSILTEQDDKNDILVSYYEKSDNLEYEGGKGYFMTLLRWANRLDIKSSPYLSWVKCYMSKQGISLLKCNIMLAKIVRNHKYLEDYLSFMINVLSYQCFFELVHASEQVMCHLPMLKHMFLIDSFMCKLIINLDELKDEKQFDKERLRNCKTYKKFIHLLLNLIKMLHYAIKREIYQNFITIEAQHVRSSHPFPNPPNFHIYYDQAIRSIAEKICIRNISHTTSPSLPSLLQQSSESESLNNAQSITHNLPQVKKAPKERYLTNTVYYVNCQLASLSSENLIKYCLLQPKDGTKKNRYYKGGNSNAYPQSDKSQALVSSLLSVTLSFCLDKWNSLSIESFPPYIADSPCKENTRNNSQNTDYDSYLSSVFTSHIKLLSINGFDSSVSLKRLFKTSLILLSKLLNFMSLDNCENDVNDLMFPIFLDARTDYITNEIIPKLEKYVGATGSQKFRYNLSFYALKKCKEILDTLTNESFADQIRYNILELMKNIIKNDFGVETFFSIFNSSENYMSLFKMVNDPKGLTQCSDSIKHSLLTLFTCAFQNLSHFNATSVYMESLDNFVTTFLMVEENIDSYFHKLLGIPTEEDITKDNDVYNMGVISENCKNFYSLINYSYLHSSLLLPLTCHEKILSSLASIMIKLLSHFKTCPTSYEIYLACSHLFLCQNKFAFASNQVGVIKLTLFATELLGTLVKDHYVRDFLSPRRTIHNASKDFYVFLCYVFTFLDCILTCVQPYSENMNSYNDSNKFGDTLDIYLKSNDRNHTFDLSEENFEDSLSDESEYNDLNVDICTFTFTNKEFIEQHWYNCHTCSMVDGVGVCSPCARICHKGHDVTYSKYGSFFCDCGAKEDGSCKALVINNNVSLSPDNKNNDLTSSHDGDLSRHPSIKLLSTRCRGISECLENDYSTFESLVSRCKFINPNLPYQSPGSKQFSFYTQNQINKLKQEGTDLYNAFIGQKIFAKINDCVSLYVHHFIKFVDSSNILDDKSSYFTQSTVGTPLSLLYYRIIYPLSLKLDNDDSSQVEGKNGEQAIIETYAKNEQDSSSSSSDINEILGKPLAILGSKFSLLTGPDVSFPPSLSLDHYGSNNESDLGHKDNSGLGNSNVIIRKACANGSGNINNIKGPAIMVSLRPYNLRFARAFPLDDGPSDNGPFLIVASDKDKLAMYRSDNVTMADSNSLSNPIWNLKMPFSINSLVIHPKTNQHIAIIGDQDIIILTIDEKATLTDRYHLSPSNDTFVSLTSDALNAKLILAQRTQSAILKGVWLTPSRGAINQCLFKLAVLNKDSLKIYDFNDGNLLKSKNIKNKNIPLEYSFVIPNSSMTDSCCIIESDGSLCILIMSQASVIYYQPLNDEAKYNGVLFYVTNAIYIAGTSDSQSKLNPLFGGGKTLYYSNSLNLILMSFVDGTTLLAKCSRDTVNGNLVLDIRYNIQIPKIKNAVSIGAYYDLNEIPEIPGIITCKTAVKWNNESNAQTNNTTTNPITKMGDKANNKDTLKKSLDQGHHTVRHIILGFTCNQIHEDQRDRDNNFDFTGRMYCCDLITDMEQWEILPISFMISESSTISALTVSSNYAIFVLFENGDLMTIDMMRPGINPVLGYITCFEGPLAPFTYKRGYDLSESPYAIRFDKPLKIIKNDDGKSFLPTSKDLKLKSNLSTTNTHLSLPPDSPDYFESCQLCTTKNLEFGGSDFLEIYDKAKLVQRLTTPGLFVAVIPFNNQGNASSKKDDINQMFANMNQLLQTSSSKGSKRAQRRKDEYARDYVKLEISLDKSSPPENDMYVAGLQVQIGCHSLNRSPSYLKIGKRTIEIKNLKKSRWYDIALSQNESSKFGNCIILRIGHSKDPRKITIIDNIKVYCRNYVSSDKKEYRTSEILVLKSKQDALHLFGWQLVLRRPFQLAPLKFYPDTNLINMVICSTLTTMLKLVALCKEKPLNDHLSIKELSSKLINLFHCHLSQDIYKIIIKLLDQLLPFDDFLYQKDRILIEVAFSYIKYCASYFYNPTESTDYHSYPDIIAFTDLIATLRRIYMLRPAQFASYAFSSQILSPDTPSFKNDETSLSSYLDNCPLFAHNLFVTALNRLVSLDTGKLFQTDYGAGFKIMGNQLPEDHHIANQFSPLQQFVEWSPNFEERVNACVFAACEMMFVTSFFNHFEFLAHHYYKDILQIDYKEMNNDSSNQSTTNETSVQRAVKFYCSFLIPPPSNSSNHRSDDKISFYDLIAKACQNAIANLLGNYQKYADFYRNRDAIYNTQTPPLGLKIPANKMEEFIPRVTRTKVHFVIDYSSIIVINQQSTLNEDVSGIQPFTTDNPIEYVLFCFLKKLPDILTDVRAGTEADPYFQNLVSIVTILFENSSYDIEKLHINCDDLLMVLTTLVKRINSQQIAYSTTFNHVGYYLIKFVNIFIGKMWTIQDGVTFGPAILGKLKVLFDICLESLEILDANFWTKYPDKDIYAPLSMSNKIKPFPYFSTEVYNIFFPSKYYSILKDEIFLMYPEMMTRLLFNLLLQLGPHLHSDPNFYNVENATSNHLQKICLNYMTRLSPSSPHHFKRNRNDPSHLTSNKEGPDNADTFSPENRATAGYNISLFKQVKRVMLNVCCCGSRNLMKTRRDVFLLTTRLGNIENFLNSPLFTTNTIASDVCFISVKEQEALAKTLYFSEWTSHGMDYSVIESLVSDLKYCLEIAIVRRLNWVRFCMTQCSVFNTLLRCACLFADCEISCIILKLLLATLDGCCGKGHRVSNGASESPSFSALMENDIQKYLVEFIKSNLINSTNIDNKWLARKFIIFYYNSRRSSHDKLKLIQTMIVDCLPVVLQSGSKSVQFIDTLSYLIHKQLPKKHDTNNNEYFKNIALYVFQHMKLLVRVIINDHNARLYAELARYIKLDDYYLQTYNACVHCAPREAYANIKLSSIKRESKYTSFSIIVKLTSCYVISSLSIKISDIKKSKMVKTMSIFVNNNRNQSVVELKNSPRSSWFCVINEATLQPLQTWLKTDFPFPVLACNVKILYDSFHESPNHNAANSNGNGGVSCPRCNTLVISHTGICTNCGENVFQCSKCRSINYDDKDPFLCINCGFCKYAKFEYSVNSHQCFVTEPIINEDGYKNIITQFEILTDKYEKYQKQIKMHRTNISDMLTFLGDPNYFLNLNSSIELYAPHKELSTNVTKIPSQNDKDPQKLIQILNNKYHTECKVVYTESQKLMFQMNSLKKELKISRLILNSSFDNGLNESKVLEILNKSEDYDATTDYCLRCAYASIEHILMLIQALVLNDEVKRLLIETGIIDELIDYNTFLNFDSTRKILSYLIINNGALLKSINQSMFERIQIALGPLLIYKDRVQNISSKILLYDSWIYVKHYAAILINNMDYLDDEWETRFRYVIRLFAFSVKYLPVTAFVHEQLTLHVGRYLVNLISSLPDSKSLKKSKKRVNSPNKAPIDKPKKNIIKRPPLKTNALPPHSNGFDLTRWLNRDDNADANYWATLDEKSEHRFDRISINSQSWVTNLLFSPYPKLRQLAITILKNLNQKMDSPQVLNYLLSFLNQDIMLFANYTDEYFDYLLKFFKSPIDSPKDHFKHLDFQCLKNLITLIIREKHIAFDRSLHFEKCLHSMIELLEMYCDDSRQIEHIPFVLNTYLELKTTADLKSKSLNFTIDKLYNLLIQATSKDDGLEKIVPALVNHLAHDVLVPRSESIDFVKTSICLELLEELFVKPTETKDHGNDQFFLVIEKDVHQEDYLQGRMQENPYTSTGEGLGPCMRDVKNKICRDCELIALLEDDSGMELLVDNKIMNLNLLVKDVFIKVWIPTHPSSDTMLVIYRVRGLLGDATEEFIETLNGESSQKKKNSLDTSSNSTDAKGLKESKSDILDHDLDELTKRNIAILKNTRCYKELLRILKNMVNPVSLSNTLVQLLNIVAYLMKSEIFINEEILSPSSSIDQESSTICVLLDLLEKIINVSRTTTHKNTSSLYYQETIGKSQEKLLRSCLDIMATILSHNLNGKYNPCPHIIQRLLKLLEEPDLKLPQLQLDIIKMLPYLMTGSTNHIQTVLDHYTPVLDFEGYDNNQTPQTTVSLDQFVSLLRECHSALFNVCPMPIFLSQLLNFLTRLNDDCVLNRSLQYVGLKTGFGDWKSVVTSKFPSLSYVLKILTGIYKLISLSNLAATAKETDGNDSERKRKEESDPNLKKDIEEAQETSYDKSNDIETDITSLLKLLHKLEQTSTEDHLGTLAETLMNTLLQTDPSVQQKIEKIRHQTKLERKKIAMAKREKRLEALGMKTNVKGQVLASDATNPLTSHLDNLTNESGLICCICFEGYRFQPKKMLAIYTLIRKIELINLSQSVKKAGHVTFSNFNIVHIDCHNDSLKQTKSRNEWDGATLINSNIACNSLLPLWGINITETAFVQSLTKFFKCIRDVASLKDITHETVAYNIKTLISRLAEEKYFTDDIAVGTKESNIKLLPYLMNIALYLTIQHKTHQNMESNLNSFIKVYQNLPLSEALSKLSNSTHDDAYFYSVISLLATDSEWWYLNGLAMLKNSILLEYLKNFNNENILREPMILETSFSEFLMTYSNYKTPLLFYMICSGIYQLVFKDVNMGDKDSNVSWPQKLSNYIRLNDELILKGCQEMLKRFDIWITSESVEELFIKNDMTVNVEGVKEIFDILKAGCTKNQHNI